MTSLHTRRTGADSEDNDNSIQEETKGKSPYRERLSLPQMLPLHLHEQHFHLSKLFFLISPGHLLLKGAEGTRESSGYGISVRVAREKIQTE